MGGRRKIPTQGPHPVDTHVGNRIRLRRVVLGVSQSVLAEAIGLTFQQVQKYESGHNRVSASTLYDIAKVLKCRPAFFYEELEMPVEETGEHDPMTASSAVAVVGAFNKLRDDQQKAVMDVMYAMRVR